MINEPYAKNIIDDLNDGLKWSTQHIKKLYIIVQTEKGLFLYWNLKTKSSLDLNVINYVIRYNSSGFEDAK